MATETNNTTSTMITADQVKRQLQNRHIQLWKPPYYGVRGGMQAVQNLARTLFVESDNEVAATAATPDNATTIVIQNHLVHFQQHALAKLRAKHKLLEELQIQILAGNILHSFKEQSTPETWAEQVTVDSNNNKFCLTLHRVNPNVSLLQFVQDLASWMAEQQQNESNSTQNPRLLIRLVHRGKTLAVSGATSSGGATTTTTHTTLCEQLLCQNNDGTGKAKVLCLVRQQQQQPTLAEENEAAPAGAKTGNEEETAALVDPDQALMDSMRTAANKLRNSGGMMLDITDAAGNLVSMTHAERLAFLMALGLHAVGRERMSLAAAATAASNNHNSTNANANQHWQSALVFLLQADEEWNHLAATWQTKVDNYGLLQLDISWIHLQLQSLEELPHIVQRLDQAERVLRQQVNVNFVTLALVQAEMDHPVPALAAMFVRLFLLQGVALHHHATSLDSDQQAEVIQTKSKERLDWAWALAKSLRAVSPPDAVARLAEAMGGGNDAAMDDADDDINDVSVTNFTAISALRRTNGNVNQAAELIQNERQAAQKTEEDRYRQRRYGLCQNGQDYVDLQLLVQLQTVLGLDENDGNDSTASMVASGLLRLSNNHLEGAIDIYQNCLRNPETVLQRVDDLDQGQGRRRYKRSRRQQDPQAAAVDEMALVTLLSMGVDEPAARRALAANQNQVETALLWLSTNNNTQEAGTTATGANTSNQEASTAINVIVAGGEEGEPVNTDDDAAAAPQANTDMQDDDDSRRERLNPQELAEREAMELLERVLGDALAKQDRGEGCLGNSLDEEWGFIQLYRGAP